MDKRVFKHKKSGNFYVTYGIEGKSSSGNWLVQTLKAGKGFGPLRRINESKLEEVPAEWFLKTN